MPKNLISIIARSTSIRLPQKIFSDVAGTPFLQRLVTKMQAVKRKANVVICTSDHDSDAELRRQAVAWKAEVYGGSLSDVMRRLINMGQQFGADNLVRVTGDNLFTSPALVDFLLHTHGLADADFTKIDGLPLGVNADVLSLAALEDVYKNLPDGADTEYIQLYTYNPDKYKCLIHYAPVALRRPELSLTMDHQHDLDMIRFVVERLGDDAPLEAIIKLLESSRRAIHLAPEIQIKVPGGTKDWQEYKAFMTDIRERANAVIDPNQFANLQTSSKFW